MCGVELFYSLAGIKVSVGEMMNVNEYRVNINCVLENGIPEVNCHCNVTKNTLPDTLAKVHKQTRSGARKGVRRNE